LKNLQLFDKKNMVLIKKPKEDQTAQKKHNDKNYPENILCSLPSHFNTG